MNPLRRSLYHLGGLALVLCSAMSTVSGQSVVSAFGRISEVEKVTEGPIKKIESTLRQAQLNVTDMLATRGPGEHVAAMSVDKLWQVRENGAIEVYLWLTDLTDREVEVLKNARVEIASSEPTVLKAVSTWLLPAAIDRVAELDIVTAIRFPNYGRTNTGSVTTQGDALHRAAAARIRGFDGKNVKIGVISDGVSNRNVAAASGDLPQTSPGSGIANIHINPALPGSGDEGTAMLEIIHDIAPGAALAFSRGSGGSIEYINSVNWLKNTAGCNVICDDIGIFTEAYFSDSSEAITANLAVANGAVYVAACGNHSQRHHQGFYAGTNFQPTFIGAPAWSLHNWNLAGDHSLDIGVAPSGGVTNITVVLQWDEPFNNSTSDYDLYIVNAAETVQLASSTNPQTGGVGTFPVEIAGVNVAASGSQTNLKIWVRKRNLAAPDRNIELFVLQNGGTAVFTNMIEYIVPGDSIFGHQAASSVISVAATDQAAYGSCTIEWFSSIGPSTIKIPTPHSRITPTLTGVDGVSVTGAGGFPSPFFGTSAAAPHVAAIAALLRSASPASTAAQIQVMLQQGALDCASPGFDYLFGYGRVDAFRSLGLACPGADFEGQPGGCTYAFPSPLGAIGDCEGVSCNGLATVTVDSSPTGTGFPSHGNQYARVWASGPGSALGAGNELYLRLKPMTLRWDFYNVEGPNSGYNDGMSIDIVAADGTTVIANLAYADTFTPAHLGQDFSCGSGGFEIAPNGPQTLIVNMLPGGAYVRIKVWNGADNLYPSSACIDVDSAPHLGLFSNGPQTVGFSITGGPSFGSYYLAVTTTNVSFPWGWFYGIDITLADIMNQLTIGAPYVGSLDRNGAFSFGPICCLPSTLTAYAVALLVPGPVLGLPTSVTAPVAYTIP